MHTRPTCIKCQTEEEACGNAAIRKQRANEPLNDVHNEDLWAIQE